MINFNRVIHIVKLRTVHYENDNDFSKTGHMVLAINMVSSSVSRNTIQNTDANDHGTCVSILCTKTDCVHLNIWFHKKAILVQS